MKAPKPTRLLSAHVWRNEFLLQALVSTLPSVLFVASVPIFTRPQGLSIVQLGFAFLLVRAGYIAGSLACPHVLSRLAPHRAAVLCEAVIFLIRASCSPRWFSFGPSYS